MYKGCTVVQEHLSAAYQVECILKWHLDVIFSKWVTSGLSEGNLILELLPDLLVVVELCVIHVAFFSEHLKNLLRLETCQSMEKQSCLLCGKPFSKIFISTICESANEVTDVVVLGSGAKLFSWDSTKHLSVLIKDTLHIQLVILGVSIDLLCHNVMQAFLVRVVQKLNLLEHL